jgi:hypothetical protein
MNKLLLWYRVVSVRNMHCTSLPAVLNSPWIKQPNDICKVVGLERGPLSLVSTTEELLDRKVAAPVYKSENTAVGIRCAYHTTPSDRKSWH